MNITIKFQSNGASMEVSIPIPLNAEIWGATPASAVQTPESSERAQETASAPQQTAPACDDVVAGSQDLYGDEALACLRENIFGEKRVGEEGVGEGDGRIGGVGERKEEERVGEGEGGEENHEQFKCSDGFYVIPPALYSDFCAAFGQEITDLQFKMARLWLETNPLKRKTRRGMGRFLNAWLCRAQGEKRVALKGRSGSLLDAAPSKQEGW